MYLVWRFIKCLILNMSPVEYDSTICKSKKKKTHSWDNGKYHTNTCLLCLTTLEFNRLEGDIPPNIDFLLATKCIPQKRTSLKLGSPCKIGKYPLFFDLLKF